MVAQGGLYVARITWSVPDVLQGATGGLSGPAIRPLAVRCVYELCGAVSIPVIGVGGVSCGRDAVEMLMAGATAVGVGSAVYYGGIEVFSQIRDEADNATRKRDGKNPIPIRQPRKQSYLVEFSFYNR